MEREAFEKEVSKLRAETEEAGKESALAKQRVKQVEDKNRKLEAENYTCAREMEQKGESRKAEELSLIQSQLEEQSRLCANLAMEAKEWQLMAAKHESTMRQLQQRLDATTMSLNDAKREMDTHKAQSAILAEQLARSEKGAYTREWMELSEHWEAQANTHRQEAEEAQIKLAETQSSLDVALSTSDAIKVEVEKEFARLTEEASTAEAKATVLEEESSLMKVTIATLTAEASHLKAQLDMVLTEARSATMKEGAKRTRSGQESASRARRGASPDGEITNDRLSLSISALSVSEEGVRETVEDLGHQLRTIAEERDALREELETTRASKATVESALLQISSKVKALESSQGGPQTPDDVKKEIQLMATAKAEAEKRTADLETQLKKVKGQSECLRFEIAQLENDRSEASKLATEATETAAKAYEAQNKAEMELIALKQALTAQNHFASRPTVTPTASASTIQPYEPKWMRKVNEPNPETEKVSTSGACKFFLKSRFSRTEEMEKRIEDELSKERSQNMLPQQTPRDMVEDKIPQSPTLKQIMGLQQSGLHDLVPSPKELAKGTASGVPPSSVGGFDVNKNHGPAVA